MKAYVPYTEEFLRRVELRRNAMLVDVVEPADLGFAPQQTIANALARRFGGYAHDFFVSRYGERDFAIFLPGWVVAEVLIRRQIITLDAIWLRCYAWGPYRTARLHRILHTAWIQLRNLPFECWTSARVASMISGFGRFIKADDVSKSMADLRAYRCRIAVDDIREIPRSLYIVLGDEIFAVQVHLESWERAQDGGGGVPPAPPPFGPNNALDDGAGPEQRGGVGEIAAQAGDGVGGGEDVADEADHHSEVSDNLGGGRSTRVFFQSRVSPPATLSDGVDGGWSTGSRRGALVGTGAPPSATWPPLMQRIGVPPPRRS